MEIASLVQRLHYTCSSCSLCVSANNPCRQVLGTDGAPLHVRVAVGWSAIRDGAAASGLSADWARSSQQAPTSLHTGAHAWSLEYMCFSSCPSLSFASDQ